MTAEERLEPVFGPDGLPDAATLAGLQLDAFDAETTARIRARISNSPEAAQTLAALDAVGDDLRAQPPIRMPDAVADRISAALRTEQESRAAQQAADTGPPGGTVPPQPAGVVSLDAARQRRAGRTKWMGLAAAGVAVVAAGGIAYGLTSHSTTGGTPSTPPQAFAKSPSVTAPGAGNNAQSSPATPRPSYSRSTLVSGLAALVAGSKVGINVPGHATGGLDTAACAKTLGQQANPLAARRITFESQDAYVFVFATGTDHQARVFVVNSTCAGAPIYQTTGTY